MKSLVLNRIVCFVILITFSSCNSDVSSVYFDNSEKFKSLLNIIQENDLYFKNSVTTPRIFYTNNFGKSFEEFKSLENVKINISKNHYKQLQELFGELNINEFYLINNGNILFKVKENDFFIKRNNYYISFIDDESVIRDLKNSKDLNLVEYSVLDSHWYAILLSTSPAN